MEKSTRGSLLSVMLTKYFSGDNGDLRDGRGM